MKNVFEMYQVEIDGIQYRTYRINKFAPRIGRRFRPGQFRVTEQPDPAIEEMVIAKRIFGVDQPHAISRAVNRQEKKI